MLAFAGRWPSSAWLRAPSPVATVVVHASRAEGRGDPPHAAALPPQVLTKMLQTCSYWQDLRRLMQQHGRQLDAIHCSVALLRVAHLQRQGPRGAAPQRGVQHRSSTSPPVFSSGPAQPGFATDWQLEWAAGSKGITSNSLSESNPDAADLRAFISELYHLTLERLPSMQARQVANVLWGACKLRQRPPAAWIAAFIDAAHERMRAFQPQELSNVLYALNELRCQPTPAWLQAYYAASHACLARYNAQDVSNTLSAAAKLQLQPQREWLDRLLQQFLHCMGAATPQALANTTHALGVFRYQPPAEWTAVFLRQCAVKTGAFNGQELSMTLWGAARLSFPIASTPVAHAVDASCSTGGGGGTYLELFAQRLQQQLPYCNGQEIANCVWSLATLNYEGSHGAATSQTAASDVSRRAEALSGASGDVSGPGAHDQQSARVTEAAIQQQGGPPPLLLHQLLDCSRPQLHAMTCQGLVNILWGFMRLSYQPDGAWMHQFLSQTVLRLSIFSARDLSSLLHALAKLRFVPPDKWMVHYYAEAEAKMAGCNAQDAANMLYAVARLGLQPERRWIERLLVEMLATGEPRAGMYRPAEPSVTDLSGLSSTAALHASRNIPHIANPEPSSVAALQPSQADEEYPAFTKEAPCCSLSAQTARYSSDQRPPGTHSKLSHMKGNELVMTMWSLARLDILPSAGWCGAFVRASAAAMPTLSARELAQLAYCIAKVSLVPDGDWVRSYVQCLSRKFEYFTSAELTQALKALARIQQPALNGGRRRAAEPARAPALQDRSSHDATGLALVPGRQRVLQATPVVAPSGADCDSNVGISLAAEVAMEEALASIYSIAGLLALMPRSSHERFDRWPALARQAAVTPAGLLPDAER